MKKFLAISVLVLAFAASAHADTVHLRYLHPGENVSGGYYTYPYYFSINGGTATPLMCDAFTNHIAVGDSWSAHVSGLLSGKGLFGTDIQDYKAAGIIFNGVMNGTIDAKIGNVAVWNLFDRGITTDAAVLALDGSALLLAQHAPSGEFKGLVLYTPVGGSPGIGPQEFIGYQAVPEPSSLVFFGTGLLGIIVIARKRFAVAV